MTDDRRVCCAVVGYPGAGKSEFGRLLSEYLDGIFIETGDVVREGAEEHFGCPSDELSSNELGDYSTMRRERDGGDYIAQDVIDRLDAHDEYPERPVVLAGIRDTEATPVFNDHFDQYTIIWVHAPFETRLDRLTARGRQDEDGFTADDLAARDGRESMWGTTDLAYDADRKVTNDGDLNDLEQSAMVVSTWAGCG